MGENGAADRDRSVAEVTARKRAVRVSPSPSTTGAGGTPVVVEPGQDVIGRHAIQLGAIGGRDAQGRRSVEVVVDGWRFEFVVEDDERARLREWATRDRDARGTAGEALEIRAIIPGRIASVAVTAGDAVEAGQTLLAVEAMKMQNELRAPRPGSVARVPATVGSTVEVGDILVVLE
jgi:pyruvate carboxylase